MTIIESQKIFLRDLAREINENYFALLDRIESGLITINEVEAIKEQVESYESLIAFVRSEALNLNKEAVKNAAREIEKIVREGGK
ncbi:MAG: hypothetical protein LBU73_00640 [Helicobacteraceae bacterium]|jgi:hypothetical protein|nr:hypothetical protein [Helicobacteraceae bacterium]